MEDFSWTKHHATCNDLFWIMNYEALLGNESDSEQPKNRGSVNSEHCLVFLKLEIKYSTRK